MRTGMAAVAMIVLACSACREGPSVPGATEATSKPASADSAIPVSTSGVEGAFCNEHGVPEAVCTKCNPTLIPVFKAKGDWCEEHGFPESFCPICHPERGGRPASEAARGEPPADGTKVIFKTRETARLAGLRTVEASRGGGDSHLVVAAKIVYDAARIAQVNARASGVVRAVRVDVGARVRSGSPLAVIESAGVGADQSRLQAARSRVHVAESNHARLQKLFQDGLTSEVDVLAARRDLDEAEADLDTARAALGMVGGTTDGEAQYTLVSPIAGIVTTRTATIGRLVDTEEILFEVVNTATMWAEIEIPETEVNRLATGQRIVLTVDGLGEREFSGTLSYIAPEIDPHTRTAKGRISLANPDVSLRANMFARARIEGSGTQASVLVPRSAVQNARGAQLVFVRLAEQMYEARRVVMGPPEGELVEVSGRISPGDRVVTDGSFLLKTETLKESIGAGCCDVEQAR